MPTLSQALFPHGIVPGKPCVVALCGGGGKTTLMYTLARELTAQGVPVVCSTTTRLFLPCIPEEVQALLLAETADLFAPSLLERTPVLVAERLLSASPQTDSVKTSLAETDSVKLAGLAPEILDALADVLAAHVPSAVLLVEADGAARKPLKAPLAHEPVFPARTTLAVAVVGLDAVNAPLDAATTHRLEQVCALTGLAPGDPVSLAALTTLAEHPHGWFQHCPTQARRVVFGNKADACPLPQGWPRSWLAGSAREGWCL